MKKVGIYKITNIEDGKMYIGSSKNIDRRFKEHKNKLNNKNHHNIHLQNAWNDNFIFEILELTSENDLIIREQYWMDYYLSYDRNKGYNISPMADRTVFSEESKKKMSESRLKMPGRSGWEHKQETKDKIGNSIKLRNIKMDNKEKEDKTIKIDKEDWIKLKYLALEKEISIKNIIHKLLIGELKILK